MKKNVFLTNLLQELESCQKALNILSDVFTNRDNLNKGQIILKQLIATQLETNLDNFDKTVKAFITPFDKDDLILISDSLFDILKLCEQTLLYFSLIFDENIKTYYKKFINSLREKWNQFLEAFDELFKNKKLDLQLKLFIRIEKSLLIDDCNVIIIKELFFLENDVKNLIKWLKVYETLLLINQQILKTVRIIIYSLLKNH